MRKFLAEAPVEIETPRGHRFRILRRFCKGCRICVEFCPSGTLALDDRNKVDVVHAERCIGCRMCEMRCPDLAIFLTKAGSAAAAATEERT